MSSNQTETVKSTSYRERSKNRYSGVPVLLEGDLNEAVNNANKSSADSVEVASMIKVNIEATQDVEEHEKKAAIIHPSDTDVQPSKSNNRTKFNESEELLKKEIKHEKVETETKFVAE